MNCCPVGQLTNTSRLVGIAYGSWPHKFRLRAPGALPGLCGVAFCLILSLASPLHSSGHTSKAVQKSALYRFLILKRRFISACDKSCRLHPPVLPQQGSAVGLHAPLLLCCQACALVCTTKLAGQACRQACQSCGKIILIFLCAQCWVGRKGWVATPCKRLCCIPDRSIQNPSNPPLAIVLLSLHCR